MQKELISLQFKTKNSFNKNLKKLKSLLKETPENSIILAPEVSLTGFCYDRFDKGVEFSIKAIDKIKKLTKNRVFAITILEKIDNEYFNVLKVFHNKKILYSQKKHKLFPLGDEHKYFSAGREEDIKIFEINGVKFASLICFEIRFSTLWERVKGADIILVPAMWGSPRREHFETLTKALAISNQCFVIASNSANSDMLRGGGVITPFGNLHKNYDENIISAKIDFKEIKKMRKYINIGFTPPPSL